ncbi:MAG TPA: glycoside hydrolase family 2 TIM barrel-domain containing protein [Tepidisphaeraceae bacterium]
MLQRDNWTNLNGPWDFAIDAEATWTAPHQVKWDKRKIVVPFAPESPASEINETGYFNAVWYRRTIDAPKINAGQRVLLHFGAVDYEARVWVNGQLVAHHEGGYTPFFADITDALDETGEQTIIVCAQDSPHDLTKPRGKQDWQLNPHSIWYYRTTGIWQTVWMEVVPATRIASLQWMPNVERFEMCLDAKLAGPVRSDMRLHVKLTSRNRLIADDVYTISHDCVLRKIGIVDPGIDDYRNELLWHPNHPNLIDAEIELRTEDGQLLDRVISYCAMRQVATVGNRLILNGKPYTLMFLLDQGYWPQSGLTAPDDAALKRDVELVREMGFIGVRKHQKIEDPRFLYWADRLGLLVWEEMPSPYRFAPQSIQRMSKQWMEAIQRDSSHPCIIAWVPFNESWGVPDLPHDPAQRNAIQGMYHLTKTLDPTRPVIGNDGWELAETDIIAIHDYEADPRRLTRRYGVTAEQGPVQHLLSNERPGNKLLMLNGFAYGGQPIMLTEFGGIAFSKDWKHTWGYSRAKDADDFASRYAHLLAVVRSLPIFSGFCYTQFTDTYQEANGLLNMDRTPKFPIAQIAAATRGAQSEDDHKAIDKWRKLTTHRLSEMDRANLHDAK